MLKERSSPGVVRRSGILWPANIRAGMYAWLLHRVSGLALIFYLMAHIPVLSTVLRGPNTFNAVMEYLHSPLYLTLDLLLLVAVVFHGINGIRVVLFDLGIGIRKQKGLFFTAMGLTALIFLAGVIAIWPVFFH